MVVQHRKTTGAKLIAKKYNLKFLIFRLLYRYEVIYFKKIQLIIQSSLKKNLKNLIIIN